MRMKNQSKYIDVRGATARFVNVDEQSIWCTNKCSCYTKNENGLNSADNSTASR